MFALCLGKAGPAVAPLPLTLPSCFPRVMMFACCPCVSTPNLAQSTPSSTCPRKPVPKIHTSESWITPVAAPGCCRPRRLPFHLLLCIHSTLAPVLHGFTCWEGRGSCMQFKRSVPLSCHLGAFVQLQSRTLLPCALWKSFSSVFLRLQWQLKRPQKERPERVSHHQCPPAMPGGFALGPWPWALPPAAAPAWELVGRELEKRANFEQKEICLKKQTLAHP